MKALTIGIILVLFVVGIGGGYFFITQTREEQAPADASPAPVERTVAAEGGSGGHGQFPQIPSGATICTEHRVPEIVCPFCNPEVIDEFGHCGGHDVPEALCTRCHPILIAAFKAENDWCAEHELPESQCLECNPPASG